jgi:hypothetical protein
VLKRDYGLKVSASTANRYLHKHKRIDPKVSQRNEKAWKDKIEREKKKEVSLQAKYRPPSKIKDYAPGALVEKDMKYVPILSQVASFSPKYHLKDKPRGWLIQES